jgi:hypothetical protein
MVLTKAAISTCNMTPNLGTILFFYLNYQALQRRGPISCGGVITVLANALRLNLGNLQPLPGERRVGFTTLNACDMVKKCHGRYLMSEIYVHFYKYTLCIFTTHPMLNLATTMPIIHYY